MAVKFSALKNDPARRKVRDTIVTGNDIITVYEPSSKDAEQIIELQGTFLEGKTVEGQEGAVRIDGADIVRVLIPMLTDIEGLEDLTDEEVADIVENPTTALTQVQAQIKIIITEVYKSVVLAAKSDLLEAELASESTQVEKQAFDSAFKMAAKEVGKENLIEKIRLLGMDAEDAIKEEAQKMAIGKLDKKPSLSTSKVVPMKPRDLSVELEDTNPQLKAQRLLEMYKKDFSDGDAVPLVEKDDD